MLCLRLLLASLLRRLGLALGRVLLRSRYRRAGLTGLLWCLRWLLTLLGLPLLWLGLLGLLICGGLGLGLLLSLLLGLDGCHLCLLYLHLSRAVLVRVLAAAHGVVGHLLDGELLREKGLLVGDQYVGP